MEPPVCKAGLLENTLYMYCCCWYLLVGLFRSEISFIAFFLDIDECLRGLHNCSLNAYCNNTKGSYNCTCKPGFTGNGRECKGNRLG